LGGERKKVCKSEADPQLEHNRGGRSKKKGRGVKKDENFKRSGQKLKGESDDYRRNRARLEKQRKASCGLREEKK